MRKLLYFIRHMSQHKTDSKVIKNKKNSKTEIKEN